MARGVLCHPANMPPTAALALMHQAPAEPLPQTRPVPGALRALRERIRQGTSDEVEARSKLLLQQLETLARFTARELARKGGPDPLTLRSELDSLQQGLHEVSAGSVEFFACRITCQELSERVATGRRRRGPREGALKALEGVRLDARTLFEWAKSDLWTGVARRAIVEANRTALDLERETPATLCRVKRMLARVGPRGAGHELAQVAEDLAFHELGRILAVGHGLRLPSRNDPLQQLGLRSAHGILSRLAPRVRSTVAA
jgi:hypothetical protein